MAMSFESIEETITAFYIDKMPRNSGSLDYRLTALQFKMTAG